MAKVVIERQYFCKREKSMSGHLNPLISDMTIFTILKWLIRVARSGRSTGILGHDRPFSAQDFFIRIKKLGNMFSKTCSRFGREAPNPKSRNEYQTISRNFSLHSSGLYMSLLQNFGTDLFDTLQNCEICERHLEIYGSFGIAHLQLFHPWPLDTKKRTKRSLDPERRWSPEDLNRITGWSNNATKGGVGPAVSLKHMQPSGFSSRPPNHSPPMASQMNFLSSW